MTQDSALEPEADLYVRICETDARKLLERNIHLQEQLEYTQGRLCELEALLESIEADYECEACSPPARRQRGFLYKLLDLPMQLFYYFRGWG